MSGAEREMTLAEWVGRLPDFHAASKEYAALRAERDEALTLLREVREDAKYFRMPTDRIDAFLAKHKEQR
jgi:uncharacterized coiled-coil DUF342 family protein